MPTIDAVKTAVRARRGAALAAALGLAGCVAPGVRAPTPAPALPPVRAAAPADAPTPPRPLASLIAADPALSRFRLLARAGGLDRLLAGRGASTVMAPTDAAFARLPPGTVEALLQPGNRPSLLHVLRYWIVPGRVFPDDIAARLAAGGPVRLSTLDGEPLTLAAASGATMLVDAAGRRGFWLGETPASDGVLIAVNGVVAPRSIEPGATATGR